MGIDERSIVRTIVRSYDSTVIRAYSRIRFTILRQCFLEEIGQYLPKTGRVLDIGCGFGLFSLYFAARERGRTLLGVDVQAKRIGYARLAAERLGLSNVEYRVGNAVEFDTDEQFDAVYMLDLIHHLPETDVPGFLKSVVSRLRDGGLLVLKDVEDSPRLKMWFTLLLDRLMVGREPIHYWSADQLIPLLESLGLDVVRHRMKDVLPYPHILYVGRLRSTSGTG